MVFLLDKAEDDDEEYTVLDVCKGQPGFLNANDAKMYAETLCDRDAAEEPREVAIVEAWPMTPIHVLNRRPKGIMFPHDGFRLTVINDALATSPLCDKYSKHKWNMYKGTLVYFPKFV